ncbi:MAG TPA: hypothetical protein VFF50_10405, partial [Candidatus Deferrimicrobiaceae bacterium]|nr:hypothetical protein [Candidatus Deferrimicrobiaceae bacterium]
IKIRSVEDRYDFAPGRRSLDTPLSGPVDFVWSQNIKNEADGIVPMWAFKSPAVMLQQGRVFTALMPKLSDRRREPLALDLDVTSDALPWLSYGAIPSQPYGHSYFRRSPNGSPEILGGTIDYQYSIVASSQPDKLGYRRIVRLLWADTGRKELLRSNDLQQNVTRPELVTFDEWRSDTWGRYANEVYRGFDCGSRRCGTLVSNRNPSGHWDQPAPDAWFNAWFQTLRTAYGWYLYGQRTGKKDIEDKAESVLNLALTSPREGGAFSTIYLVNENRWLPSDGWAGFGDDYHAFDMSWTAYWMLKWAQDLTPDRKKEILAFVRPYGDFLVKQQLDTGVIPSWYGHDLKPRQEFRDFNAETAASALLLASLAEETGDRTYLEAAKRAAEFIGREVLPRQRWFDFETFLSCARKPFGFYDPWTAQYPQNNLSQIQAAKAYLELFQVTKDRKYLDLGTQVLDYLLLTQQVWNNPAFSPKVVGGFTTQNTDAEWSDAREAYAAVFLWDYYNATGDREYLERAVAAARSTFAVAPWENWAHTGYIDEPGALTGFHWGAGSGMTSIEMMSPALGDAFINLSTGQGVGFNACSLRHVRVDHHSISFDLDTAPALHTLTVRFSGVDPHATYRITWNGAAAQVIDGSKLSRNGYTIQH